MQIPHGLVIGIRRRNACQFSRTVETGQHKTASRLSVFTSHRFYSESVTEPLPNR